MGIVLRSFSDGGFFMYVILLATMLAGLLVFVSLIFAIIGRIQGLGHWRIRFACTVVWVMTLTPLLVGALGTYTGLSQMEAALEMASADVREAMEERGTEVAYIPLRFGGVSTVLLFFPALAGVFIAPKRRRLESQ